MEDNALDRRLRQDCPYYSPWTATPSFGSENRFILAACLAIPAIAVGVVEAISQLIG